MDKRVREISRFFVAPPHVFPLSVCVRAHGSTHRFIHKYLQLITLHSLFLFFLPGSLLLVGYAPVNYVKAWLSLMNQCLVDCTHKFLSQSPRGKLAIFHGFVLYITQVSEKRLVKTLHRTSSGIGNLIQAPIVPTRKKWPIDMPPRWIMNRAQVKCQTNSHHESDAEEYRLARTTRATYWPQSITQYSQGGMLTRRGSTAFLGCSYYRILLLNVNFLLIWFQFQFPVFSWKLTP